MNPKSIHKKRLLLFVLLAMILSLTGCGEKKQNGESGDTENGAIAQEEAEEKTCLPQTILTEEVLQNQLMDMIDSLEEEREEAFLTTGMTQEEIDKILSDVKESRDVYHQYYVAECSYT